MTMRPEDRRRDEPLITDDETRLERRTEIDEREIVERDLDDATRPIERKTMELREQELRARKEVERAGVVRVRREVEAVPAHLEVEAFRDEVEIEREAVGREVSDRTEPWEEDGVTVFPIYEEQLVVVKRLVLKEHVRVRHVRRSEKRLLEDTVLREKLVVDDPDETGQVREVYPSDHEPEEERSESGGLLGRVMRKALD